MVSTLAAAVAILWKNSESRNGQAITKLETKVESLEIKQDESEKAILECERDRSLLRGTCNFLQTRVDSLEKLLKGNA